MNTVRGQELLKSVFHNFFDHIEAMFGKIVQKIALRKVLKLLKQSIPIIKISANSTNKKISIFVKVK